MVFNKKCYQKDGNSVCVIKFTFSDADKIYQSIGYKAFINAFKKFHRKYRKIADINYTHLPSLVVFTTC